MKKGSFSDGYIDGWQGVMGAGLVPSIPAHSIPAGKTEYQAGYEAGRAEALDRKTQEGR